MKYRQTVKTEARSPLANSDEPLFVVFSIIKRGLKFVKLLLRVTTAFMEIVQIGVYGFARGAVKDFNYLQIHDNNSFVTFDDTNGDFESKHPFDRWRSSRGGRLPCPSTR